MATLINVAEVTVFKAQNGWINNLMRRIQVIDDLDLWVIVPLCQTEMVTDGQQSKQNNQPPLDKMNRLLREGQNVQHRDSMYEAEKRLAGRFRNDTKATKCYPLVLCLDALVEGSWTCSFS